MGVIEAIFITIRGGVCDMKAEPEIVEEGPTWTAYDGNRSTGYYTLTKMTRTAIEKAREHAIAISFGANHNDAGCFFAYTSMALEQDMFAMASNNSLRLIAPYGGMENIMACPPWDAVCPRGQELPLVTSVKFGEVYDADITDCALQGKKLNGNWLVDPDTGELTNDPAPYFEPIEGLGRVSDCRAASVFEHPRTYALNIMAEMMTSIINPLGVLSPELPYPPSAYLDNPDGPSVGGSFVIVIDPSHFGPVDKVKEKADSFVQTIKNAKKRPLVEEIFIPDEWGLKKIYKEINPEVELLEDHWNAFFERIEEDYGLKLDELKADWEAGKSD
jgi:LDH2 family malate/lactate/ureidoglycolate dehydrogenase